MGNKVEDLQKTLSDLERNLREEDAVKKASEQELDQPEGDDLGGKHMKGKKMSDDAAGPDKSPKPTKKAMDYSSDYDDDDDNDEANDDDKHDDDDD